MRSIGLLVVLLLSPAGVASAGDISAAEPRAEEVVSGPLDGMVFEGALGPDGKPKDTPDSFVFANGTFVSKECELRCKYPARPYYVRVNGGKTEFISETRCPYKDARIVWRGTVVGDRITGKSTWTVKRCVSGMRRLLMQRPLFHLERYWRPLLMASMSLQARVCSELPGCNPRAKRPCRQKTSLMPMT